MKTVSIFLVLLTGADVLAQNPTNYIPSLNAQVTALRFFETPYNLLPLEQRGYTDRFAKSDTRFIGWELNLEFPSPGRRISFTVEQVWYHNFGRVLARQTLQTYLEPRWTSSYHNQSWGWQNPGNWGGGSHRLDLYVQGQKVASGWFKVYHPSRDAAAANNKGIDFNEAGKYREAIPYYDQAIRLEPDYAKAYNNRCAAYSKLGNYDQAIYDCTRAIEIDPRYASAYSNRGNAYGHKGRYGDALSDHSRAIAIKPDYADAYYNRGLEYKRKGEYDRALSDYTRAIEIDPKHAFAYGDRGTVYKERGQHDQAVSDYSRAIAINPRYALPHINRGNIYKEKGRYDQAISDYTAAIGINPRDGIPYYNRAVSYYYKGEYDKAWQDVNKAQELGHRGDPALLDALRKATRKSPSL